MNLEEARDAFDKFLEGVDEYHVANFLNYIQRRWFVRDCSGVGPAIAYTRIRDIAIDIRSLVPLNGILSSEKIIRPLQGENSDCDPKHTEHMDAFLYDDYELDELERENKINRYYCQDCGSHKVQPSTFISHSASKSRIEFIFSSLLPNLTEKTVLDVGSRLGAVLYGAYFYSDAKKIIGVEMNKDFCEIQQKIIEKHNLKDRIEVICDDICNQPDVVKNSDVIILNNVFEFFLAPDQQLVAWKFLRNNITRPKTLLITVPSLEKSLKHLKMDRGSKFYNKPLQKLFEKNIKHCSTFSEMKTDIHLASWVKKCSIKDPLVMMSLNEQEELSEVCMYEVL